MDIPWICFFLLLYGATIGEAEYMRYKDANQTINVRIEDLLKRMTLAEKIGQMTQIERKVASADVMKNYFIGTIGLIYLFLYV
jgi:beta-glucosidase